MRTGFYIRIERGGRFQSLDIAELSAEEIKEAMKKKDREQVLAWVVALAQFIKEIEPIHQQLAR